MGISARTTLLIVVTTLLPLVWGWGMHLLVARLWPTGRPVSGDDEADAPTVPPLNYRI